MERASMGWLIALGCAVGSLAFLVVMLVGFLTSEVGLLDEPVHLVGGRLVRDGFVPHRDFWSMYPALDYYVIGLAFRLFGESVIVARVVQIAAYLVVLGAFAAYCRRVAQCAWPTVIVMTAVAIAATGLAFTHYAWTATATAVCAVIAALAAARSASMLAHAGVGALAATALLMKFNFGAYVSATVAAGILVRPDRPFRESLRPCAAFVAPIVLAAAGYVVAYRGNVGDVFDQIVRFPMKHLQPHRVLSFVGGASPVAALGLISAPFVWTFLRGIGRSSKRMRLGFGTLVFAVAPLAAWIGLEHPGTLRLMSLPGAAALVALQVSPLRLRHDEFVVLLAMMLFGHYFLSRADFIHYMPLVPLAMLLVPFVADRRLFATRAAYGGAVGLVIVLAGAAVGGPTVRAFDRSLGGLTTNLRAIAEAGALGRRGDPAVAASGDGPLIPLLYRDRGERDAAAFVRARTNAGDAVYVGLRSHASIFLSPTRTYWLTGRVPGVRAHMLEPGLSTEADVQRAMIDDLRARGVAWAILRENHPGDPDFERRDYHGAIVLDAYLRDAFEEVRTFGHWTVYRRKPNRD